jgi:spermidine synthase
MLLWHPQALRLEIDACDRAEPITYTFEKLLEERESAWQVIRVLAHKDLGRVLTLDNDVMSSEKDNEYDDAISALLPRDARKVLILGGGDCSLASTLCAQGYIERVTVCDIDPAVTEVCKKWLPVFLNEKVEVVHEDGFEYLKARGGEYDVLIDDMIPQPYGAEGNYWVNLAKCFRGKYVISQTGSVGSKICDLATGSLLEAGATILQSTAFITNYDTEWTFSRYRLA